MTDKEFIECHYCGGKLGFFPNKPWEGEAFKVLADAVRPYGITGERDMLDDVIEALKKDYYRK